MKVEMVIGGIEEEKISTSCLKKRMDRGRFGRREVKS
jgi:hypothetical protein